MIDQGTGIVEFLNADLLMGRSLSDLALTSGAGIGGRLTLTSGVPVTTADVAGATSIFLTPYSGQFVPGYNGVEWVQYDVGGEISLALDSNAAHTGYHQLGKLFDLFVEVSTGVPRLVSGPAWTSTTVRAQAISQLNGLWTNTASMVTKFDTSAATLTVPANQGLYVGTFGATANGQTGDLASGRNLWNFFNRKPRKLAIFDATNTWNYSVAAFQPMNANGNNIASFIRGLDEDVVLATHVAQAINSTATVRTVIASIGLDATNAKAADVKNGFGQINNAVTFPLTATYSGYPGLGFHYLCPLEFGGGADVQTWYGDNGGTSFQSGLNGWCMA